jgi:tetratricopeptide (TPR) repeat protein
MWIDKSEAGRLIEYLPRSKQGCIVFTTRDRKMAVKLAHQNVVEVPAMDDKKAIQLLQKYLVDQDLVSNEDDTRALLAHLTGLPLAIAQAAAYINENGITFAHYLSLLADQEGVIDLLSEEFEDDGRYHNVKNPVATTWLISFEQLRQRNPLAVDYLSFMSCVAPKDIPQSLLPRGPSRKDEFDAIATLDAYSFIVRPSDITVHIHQLVHFATRNWLRTQQLLGPWTEKAIERLKKVLPDHDHQNRRTWRAYLPHATYVLDSDLVNRDGLDRIDLLWRYGMCLYQDGRWNEAEASFKQMMETRKRMLGQEHPDTISAMSNLSITLGDLGRLDEAAKMKKEVLEKMRRILGEDHPSTITAMNNLSSTLGDMGLLHEAAKMKKEVLEKRSRILDEEHPDTISAMNNYAITLRDLGQLDEAVRMMKEVLDKRSRILGEEHPDTILAMNNLAVTLEDLGHLDEAITLLEVAVQKMKRVHGTEHPRTKVAVSNSTRLAANRPTSEAMAGTLETDLEAISDAAEASKPKLTPEDAVIVVLGPTGVGKSHFIRAATGDSSIKVGATLQSGKSGQSCSK